MGKSEILMLLAGVALSVMLAMVAIPMFSSGQNMADKQQVQQELLAIKSAIPLIKALEGNAAGKINATSIINNMEGFVAGTAATDVKGKSDKPLANFKIVDKATDTDPDVVTVTVNVFSSNTKVKLNELSRLSDICDGETFVPATHIVSDILTCKMRRSN